MCLIATVGRFGLRELKPQSFGFGFRGTEAFFERCTPIHRLSRGRSAWSEDGSQHGRQYRMPLLELEVRQSVVSPLVMKLVWGAGYAPGPPSGYEPCQILGGGTRLGLSPPQA